MMELDMRARPVFQDQPEADITLPQYEPARGLS
jgi:hypothetical protein